MTAPLPKVAQLLNELNDRTRPLGEFRLRHLEAELTKLLSRADSSESALI